MTTVSVETLPRQLAETGKALYADGGVIGHNPSTDGGTWAWRIVEDGRVIREMSGVITPAAARMACITNNLTEMLALILGLQELPPDWIGTVYSDSQVTLGRVFLGWQWSNIPSWMHQRYQEARARLINWDQIGHVLLDGHPTAAQLAAGVGKRGHPVSEHNRWCDQACTMQSINFKKGNSGK